MRNMAIARMGSSSAAVRPVVIAATMTTGTKGKAWVFPSLHLRHSITHWGSSPRGGLQLNFRGGLSWAGISLPNRGQTDRGTGSPQQDRARREVYRSRIARQRAVVQWSNWNRQGRRCGIVIFAPGQSLRIRCDLLERSGTHGGPSRWKSPCTRTTTRARCPSGPRTGAVRRLACRRSRLPRTAAHTSRLSRLLPRRDGLSREGTNMDPILAALTLAAGAR